MGLYGHGQPRGGHCYFGGAGMHERSINTVGVSRIDELHWGF